MLQPQSECSNESRVGIVVVVVVDMVTIAEAVELLTIFNIIAAVVPEVLFLPVPRQEGKGHSRLKPILPDAASSGGSGQQIEQRGSNSTSIRATDPAEK